MLSCQFLYMDQLEVVDTRAFRIHFFPPLPMLLSFISLFCTVKHFSQITLFLPRLLCFRKTPDTFMCKRWEGLYWIPCHFFYPPSRRWLGICKLRERCLETGLWTQQKLHCRNWSPKIIKNMIFFYKTIENQRCKLLSHCLIYLHRL
mgnify:CR=1 FL=1